MIERTNAPGSSQPPGYSHVVVASGARLVTTAGAVPLDAEGASGSDVLKTTVYVVSENREDLAAVWRVVQEESDVADAASTLLGVSLLGVSLLGYEGQLVEIEAVAVLGVAKRRRGSFWPVVIAFRREGENPGERGELCNSSRSS